MKTILITGGAGFLGSHLCKSLIDDNYIICLDNFFTGNKENIIEFMDNKNFELIRHDIINPIYLEVDEIYHLACPASPIHYQYNSIKTIKTNVIGTLNALGIAKRVKAKVLLASTSEVYGDPLEHPQVEEYWGNVNPIGIRSCYDEGKRIAESLTMDYHRQNNVDIRIARIFNTYGPNMAFDDGRVVSNFIIQALKNEPITIYGTGLQTRCFCYVDDMIDGLIKMMNNEIIGPINIGNDVEFTMLELVSVIIRLTKSKSTIIHKSLPKDDPIRRKPNIEKAIKLLNWEPTTSLVEGLSKTIFYFRKKLFT